MTSDTGVWLEDLTWPEAKARFEAGAPVVVPIGAAAKAHGPHLPLKTDALTARALAQRARGPVYGEDLAWGTGVTAQSVVNNWLASPRHRAVLLRPGFRRIGIGIAFGTFVGHGGAAVVTADFAGR